MGDFAKNFNSIAKSIEKARQFYCDIVILPELALTGYPPEDLLLKPSFIDKNLEYIEKIRQLTDKITLVCGFVNKENGIFNSAAIISDKKILSVYNKQHLYNHSFFEEERYFQKGTENKIFEIKNNLVGITICKDIHHPEDPAKIQAIYGQAQLIVNISAFPYYIGKISEYEKLLQKKSVDYRAFIAYANLVGGQDELVFEGNSLVIDANGKIISRCKPFEEDRLICDIDLEEVKSIRLKDVRYENQKLAFSGKNISLPKLIKSTTKSLESTDKESSLNKRSYEPSYTNYEDFISCEDEEILKALILGTRDYLHKNGFEKAVFGLSGGIDSALVAVIASMAIGNENITGILMPSCYSSQSSIDDSLELAKNIKINSISIPISRMYECYLESLKNIFKSDKINLTKENIQARIRGNILMALSNELGWLVLTTGNKSETGVGYCTLYGDMAGGFSPIKDIYKTKVYSLCKFINKKYNRIIPENILAKVPSAELRPNQKDEDYLPSYDLLDKIIKAYMEKDIDPDYMIHAMGYPTETVKKVVYLVDRSEYKRRQGAPGIKINPRICGKDRRYPMTNRFG